MKFNLIESLLGKKKKDEPEIESTGSTAADDLIAQIMQPNIICDHCFFDKRDSNVTVEDDVVFCHTCENELEQILMNEKGAQLAFYLPTKWSEDQKNEWVEAWKQKNFAG